ncbi:unnamed protein product [Microthlaspi erraticum]|uniref:Uncharacterized protein n=1 Tax=Microthlaspi erraticum TaxID=1685480 RepID=A0A6D2J1K8_9BRAS|nr:unnamed protein product [Microthlaspi erraticum]
MDFIKTSSPRALSELTLQRNWIGIIWMSRSEDMIKLVKTGPDGLIEHLHPKPRTPADRGTNVPRSSRAHIRISSSPRPSSRPDPESNALRSSRSLPRHHKPCTTAPREHEGNSCAAQPVNRGRPIRANRRASSRDRSRFIGQNLSIRLTPSAEHENYRPRSFRPSFGAFWSIWDIGAWRDLAHGSSSTGYAKEEGRSHLEDQLDRLLDQPVEFLNSTGQASTRSS